MLIREYRQEALPLEGDVGTEGVEGGVGAVVVPVVGGEELVGDTDVECFLDVGGAYGDADADGRLEVEVFLVGDIAVADTDIVFADEEGASEADVDEE